MDSRTNEGLFVKCYLGTVSAGSRARSENITSWHPKMDRISQHPDSHDMDITDSKIKKDKKWSLGGLFRRRKKDESESSSQEDLDSTKKGTFLLRRKSKNNESKRKRASKVVGTFDHVVVSPVMKHNTVFTKENKGKNDDNQIDPSAGFIGYVGRGLPPLEQNSYLSVSADKLPRSSRESLTQKSNVDSISRASYGSGSLESASRKCRRERAKARAEAKRNAKNDSSSDEGSQKSTTSSLSRFRSDDSLANSYKDGSLSRKSRSARTERYMKRLSKDDEVYAHIETNAVIKNEKPETEQQYGRWTSSVYPSPNSPDGRMVPKQPLSPIQNSKPKVIHTSSLPLQTSASLTSMSSHTPSQNNNKYQSATETQSQVRQIQKPPMSSNSFSNYTKPVDYINQKNDLYSGYDSNLNNKRMIHNNNMIVRHRSLNSTPQYDDGDVMVVQLPISKPQSFRGVSSSVGQYKCPPPPPPRDPQRKYISNSQLDNPRHSYAFENGSHQSIPGPQERATRVHSFNRYASPQNVPVNRSSYFGQSNNIYWNNRCSSDDHIALTEKYHQQNISYNPAVPPRPSSVTAEAMRPQIKRYITRHPPESSMKAEPQVPHYKYFADHTPRSRKPIHIAESTAMPENLYLSDSQDKHKDCMSSPTDSNAVKTASDFWKQKDQEEANRKSKISHVNNLRIREPIDIIKPKPVKQNPTLLTVKNNSDTLSSVSSRSSVSSPYQLKLDSTDDQRLSMVIEKSENNTPQKVPSKPAVVLRREPPEPPQRRSSRHSSGSSNDPMDWLDNGTDNASVTKKRRSSNLEEALSELEAIYNSLKLGDEDLLDRAELRDIPTPNLNNQNKSKGSESDSGFNFTKELDINQSALRQYRLKRRSEVPDKVADDMAYRRLNPKDRPQSQDVQSTMSQISYLLSSPLAGNSVDNNFKYHDEVDANEEPDVTLDDVVYRQIKHANNTLKVKDPQPPFGIPLGPLAPSSNSDYLHAQPENKSRPRFIPQKSPDIVTDDLAYRNLRKDQKKDSPLPPVRPEELNVFFNNNNNIDLTPKKFSESIKRKRAVRSLSENIYNLIQREADKYNEDDNDLDKSLCLSDETDTTKIKPQLISKPIRRSSYTAYSVLSDTELPKLRVSTRNLASHSPTSTETLTDSRNNLTDIKGNSFQQRLRVFVANEEGSPSSTSMPLPPKPPVKSVTPIQVSSSPIKSESDSKTEDDFLTALAREAEATSEQIDLELRELRNECLSPSKMRLTPRLNDQPLMKDSITKNNTKDNNDQIIRVVAKSATTASKSPVLEVKSSSKLIEDIDSVSEQAKLCKKLLECVVEGHQSPENSVPETIELTAAIDSDQTTELSEVDEIEPVLGGSTSPMIFTSVASLMLLNKSPKTSNDAKTTLLGNFDFEGEKIAALKDKCQLQLGELENLSIEPDYDNVTNNALKISELYCDSGIEISPHTQAASIKSEVKKQKCLNQLISEEKKLVEIPAGTSSNSINTMAAHIQNDLLTIEQLLKTQVEPTTQDDSSEYNSAEELAAIFNKSDEGNEEYVFEETSFDELDPKTDSHIDKTSTNDKLKAATSKGHDIGKTSTSYAIDNLEKASRRTTGSKDDSELNSQRGHPEGSRSTQDSIKDDHSTNLISKISDTKILNDDNFINSTKTTAAYSTSTNFIDHSDIQENTANSNLCLSLQSFLTDTKNDSGLFKEVSLSCSDIYSIQRQPTPSGLLEESQCTWASEADLTNTAMSTIREIGIPGGSQLDRIAKYKEERRKQLQQQFGSKDYREKREEGRPSTLGVTKRYITRNVKRSNTDGLETTGSSSVSDGSGNNRVRTTRASRLRAAVTTPESPTSNGLSSTKSRISPSTPERYNNSTNRSTPSPSSRLRYSPRTPELSTSSTTPERSVRGVSQRPPRNMTVKSPLEESFNAMSRIRTSTLNSDCYKNQNGIRAKNNPQGDASNKKSPARVRRVGVTSGIGSALSAAVTPEKRRIEKNEDISKKDKSSKRKSTLNMSPHSGTTDEHNDVRRHRMSLKSSTTENRIRSPITNTRSVEIPASKSRLSSSESGKSRTTTERLSYNRLDNRVSLRDNNKSGKNEEIKLIKKISNSECETSLKMDVLAARAKESILKVEKLAKQRPSGSSFSQKLDKIIAPKKRRTVSVSPVKTQPVRTEGPSPTKSLRKATEGEREVDDNGNIEHMPIIEIDNKISILRSGSEDNRSEIVVPTPMAPNSKPVSILKRKSINGESCSNSGSSNTASGSPVTFSPLVVESSSFSSRSILKKRLSMEEVTINNNDIYGRRSSLDLVKTQSILKRKTSRSEDEDYSEPHSILKTKSSSIDSSTSSNHVTIAQSVLQSVMGGEINSTDPRPILKKKSFSEDYHPYDAEAISRESSSPEPHSILKKKSNSVEHPCNSITQSVIQSALNRSEGALSSSTECVKPCLKKKSFSDEYSSFEIEGPRPILKKKSSTDSDETEEGRGKKSILKSSRKSSRDECNSEHDSPRRTPIFHHSDHPMEQSEDCLTFQSSRSEISRSSENESLINISSILDSSRKSDSFYYDLNTSLNNIVLARNRVQRTKSAATESDRPSFLIKRRSLKASSSEEEVTNTSSNTSFEVAISSSSGLSIEEPKKEVEVLAKNVSVAERILLLERSMPKPDFTKGAVPKRRSERFRTQPVTFEEIKAVECLTTFQQSQGQHKPPAANKMDESEENDATTTSTTDKYNTEMVRAEENETKSNLEKDDDSEMDMMRLSIKERVKIFTKMEESHQLKRRGTAIHQKNRGRSKTQPIFWTDTREADKVVLARESLMGSEVTFKTAREKIMEHASKMLTNEVKGILKSGTVPSFPTDSAGNSDSESKSLKSMLKRDPKEDSGIQDDHETTNNNSLRSILKPESSEFATDEGVSSSSDQSNTENENILNSIDCKSDKNDLGAILYAVEANARKELIVAEENLKNLKNTQRKENIDKKIIIEKRDKKFTKKSENGSSPVKENNHKSNKKVSEKKTVRDFIVKHLPIVDSTEVAQAKSKGSVDSCSLKNKLEKLLKHPKLPVMVSEANTESTSEGESSGGREVRRIIRNDAVARRRQAAISRKEGKPKDPEIPEDNTARQKDQKLLKTKSSSSITSIPSISVKNHQNPEDVCDESGNETRLPDFLRGGLIRSLTQPMRFSGGDCEDSEEMPGGAKTIAERLAALKKSGHNDWRKRVSKLSPDENGSTIINKEAKILDEPIIENEEKLKPVLDLRSPILADRLDKLETASKGWKNRVEPTDAVKFSVAGRMGMNIEKSRSLILSPHLLSVSAACTPTDRKKKCPTPTRFKSKKDASPQKDVGTGFKRSISAPGGPDQDLATEARTPPATDVVGPSIQIPRADDETFTSFFQSVSEQTVDAVDLGNVDLDELVGQAGPKLVNRRNVQRVQRKRIGSKNPLKTLAARTDIQDSYVQVITGVAEKEMKRIKVEKFSKGLAIEALAGLASKEDFTAVNLKKASSPNFRLVPYQPLMLIHIKGRRHVQCRLIEPIYSNINRGDNYILVTPNEVFNYVGIFSNVIEKSRGAEIAMHIQQKKDLGCTNATQVFTICEDKPSCSNKIVQNFWKLLGSANGEPASVVNAGHPDEDELYESGIIDTNMIYELQDNELVPIEEYWGCFPKIEMLDPSKVIVFDFGSEMYVWNGKNVLLDKRKIALQLAKELWAEGYNYTECDICPLTVAEVLGDCNHTNLPLKKASARPEWALLAKITQHMETILFREKFLDWPDFSRIIRVKQDDTDNHADGSIDIKPCDAKLMLNADYNEPSLLMENNHVGRGTSYFDPETSRHYEIKTLKVTAWHVQEYGYEELETEAIGHFYAGNSYIVRWQYMMTVTGRDLNGKLSRHSLSGRERCAYFCWQGRDASANEKGAAALLTVELDLERGPQVRVAQGYEPPAFINLFEGGMIIHSGKKDDVPSSPWRLYLCRGNLENECVLIQVPCSMRQLRSRGSLILINTETNTIFLWHGARSLKHTKQVAQAAALKIQSTKPSDIFSDGDTKISLTEVPEGNEPSLFLEALGGCNRNLYISLIKTTNSFEYTPRLFHLTSVSGKFESTEILSPLRHATLHTPYPFLQSELYSVSQPAIFLLDNGTTLWLWQGWWPERDVSPDSPPDSLTSCDQTGSGAVRWQAERRAAMQTAVDYWELKHGKNSEISGSLVWAGLEPLEFTSLFPIWTDRDDIAEINIREGKKPGEPTSILRELSRLTRSTYHPSVLLQRPLPEGVDPTRLELYLESYHFQEVLGMSKEEFDALPTWKQTNVKKDIGLF